MGAQVSVLQKSYTDTRTQFFGKEVQKRIFVGNFVMSSKRYNSYVHKALGIRAALGDELTSLLHTSSTANNDDPNKIHLLLLPTATSAAPTVSELREAMIKDPVKAYIDDVMTTFVNLAGLSAVAFPAGETAGLPLSMQLVGGALMENTLLSTAQAVATRHVGGLKA
jgi:aspartyl-tRNA(Asn)/glutamyl-tRNA(Gln) amidotransferase subunit A